MSFQATTLSHLQQRTDYEAWLLEEVYRITNQPIAVEDADELIYPPTGAPPTQTIRRGKYQYRRLVPRLP